MLGGTGSGAGDVTGRPAGSGTGVGTAYWAECRFGGEGGAAGRKRRLRPRWNSSMGEGSWREAGVEERGETGGRKGEEGSELGRSCWC